MNVQTAWPYWIQPKIRACLAPQMLCIWPKPESDLANPASGLANPALALRTLLNNIVGFGMVFYSSMRHSFKSKKTLFAPQKCNLLL